MLVLSESKGTRRRHTPTLASHPTSYLPRITRTLIDISFLPRITRISTNLFLYFSCQFVQPVPAIWGFVADLWRSPKFCMRPAVAYRLKVELVQHAGAVLAAFQPPVEQAAFVHGAHLENGPDSKQGCQRRNCQVYVKVR